MKKGIAALALVASMSATSAFAATSTCIQPNEPALPDPARATDTEMSQALRKMENYIPQMNAYLTCLEQAYDRARAKGEAKRADWNRAVDRYRTRN